MNTKLTAGEKLRIARRRRRNSTQADAAKRHRTSLYQYRAWEDGAEGAPKVSIGRLKPHELCMLRRIRAGLSQQELARRIRRSRWWLTQMEAGAVRCDFLVEYWSKR